MTNIAIYNGSPITRPCLYLMQKRVLASLDTHGKWQNVTTYILFTSYVWIMDSKCYHIVLKVSTNNQKSILFGSFDNTYYVIGFSLQPKFYSLRQSFYRNSIEIFQMLSIANISQSMMYVKKDKNTVLWMKKGLVSPCV